MDQSSNGDSTMTWKYSLVNTVSLALCLRSCGAFSATAATGATAPAAANDKEVIRPLHQNWWPVALENTLNENAPNAEQVLNKDVVLWHDGGEWRCMDDMCAHRFAPLSEGRTFSPSSDQQRLLSCSYHGWTFDGNGSCKGIPQAYDQQKATSCAKVVSYPVRVDAGIVWVWSDETSIPFAEMVPLPISPMLKQWQQQYPQSAYQRDLPYGYELLSENVIDMSHLPFSHHGVLSDRQNGVPLPFKMLSKKEKEAVWEKESSSLYANPIENEKVLPAYQVEVKKRQAQFADPIFAYNLMGTNEADENSTSFLGFYPPAHIRYHRTPMSGLASNTELFVCPQSAGRCRVIIFNPFEGGMQQLQSDKFKKTKPFDILSKAGNFLLRKIILSKFMGVNNHLLTSDVFDGDNIFLAQQGERMAKNGLQYKDYLTPSSADTLSKVFRKWLDIAAVATGRSRHGKADSMVEAAVGCSSDKVSPYTTKNAGKSREELLDRYHSHTKKCAVCSKALANLQQRQKVLEILNPAFFGMTGASFFAVIFSIIGMDSAVTTVAVKTVVKASITLFGTSLFLSAVLARVKSNTAKTVEKFYYQEHSHQDRNEC